VPIDIIVKFSLKGGLYVQYVYKDSTPNFTLEYYVTPDGLLYEIRQRTREVRLMRFSDNTFSDILVLVPELNDALTLSLSSTAKFANVDSRSLWNAKNEYLNKFFMNGFTAERWNSATDGSTVLIKNPKGELAYRATLLHNEQQNRNALQDGEIWDVRRYANGPKEIMKETWAVGRKNLVNDVFSFSYSIPIGKGYILEDMTSPGGKHYNIDKGD
jgi:hypothetical protein